VVSPFEQFETETPAFDLVFAATAGSAFKIGYSHLGLT
jgi:hypothetical protein